MNSIYKQLDKIDDNKSLDEKWNVKSQRELKKLKESFYDDDDYEDDYENDELEEWNWDGLKDDIDANIWDVRLDNKKPFEYYTKVIDDEYIHIIIYIENGDNTVTRYEADVVDMYAVPEDSAGVVAYIEDLPWKQTGIEPIEDDSETYSESYDNEITTTPSGTPLPASVKEIVNTLGSYEEAVKFLADELARANKEAERRTGKTLRQRLREIGLDV